MRLSDVSLVYVLRTRTLDARLTEGFSFEILCFMFLWENMDSRCPHVFCSRTASKSTVVYCVMNPCQRTCIAVDVLHFPFTIFIRSSISTAKACLQNSGRFSPATELFTERAASLLCDVRFEKRDILIYFHAAIHHKEWATEWDVRWKKREQGVVVLRFHSHTLLPFFQDVFLSYDQSDFDSHCLSLNAEMLYVCCVLMPGRRKESESEIQLSYSFMSLGQEKE